MDGEDVAVVVVDQFGDQVPVEPVEGVAGLRGGRRCSQPVRGRRRKRARGGELQIGDRDHLRNLNQPWQLLEEMVEFQPGAYSSLATSLEDLSRVHDGEGDNEKALEAVTKAVEIRRERHHQSTPVWHGFSPEETNRGR